MIKRFYLPMGLLFCSGIAAAQLSASHNEMADVMRSNGKIYVVVAVVLTILAGLGLYMIRLEKKINRLEKDGNTAMKN